jgi:hypothetical protein
MVGSLPLCLSVVAFVFVGPSFIWLPISLLFGTVIGWFVQSHMDSRSYRASPGSTGVPWRCGLDGRQFPSRHAALHHKPT